MTTVCTAHAMDRPLSEITDEDDETQDEEEESNKAVDGEEDMKGSETSGEESAPRPDKEGEGEAHRDRPGPSATTLDLLTDPSYRVEKVEEAVPGEMRSSTEESDAERGRVLLKRKRETDRRRPTVRKGERGKGTLVTTRDVDDFLGGLVLTEEEYVKAASVKQRTPEWFAYRYGRLSASNFGAAAGHHNPKYHPDHRNLLRAMLWPEIVNDERDDRAKANMDYGMVMERPGVEIARSRSRRTTGRWATSPCGRRRPGR